MFYNLQMLENYAVLGDPASGKTEAEEPRLRLVWATWRDNKAFVTVRKARHLMYIIVTTIPGLHSMASSDLCQPHSIACVILPQQGNPQEAV